MSTYKPVKTAKAMAKLADKWWALRAERLAIEKQVSDIKVEETQAKNALILSLGNNNVGAVGGDDVTVSLTTKIKPIANDWEAVWDWAVANEGSDLFQRRLSDKAVKLRWEDGVNIPGIDEYPVDSISYKKN